ncbi:YggS family pyridoxal phosphate-dependent enzyme [Nanoarchaeota archaeon]
MIPKYVKILAASKTRSVSEIQKVIDDGISIIGENYVKEAKEKKALLKGSFEFHMIGHLQKNKIKDAIQLFDMIQTVDSFELASEISKRATTKYPVLIEVNSGEESEKSGVNPTKVLDLVRKISTLPNVIVKGLMTMGPVENPRMAFRKTKQLFDSIKAMKIPNVEMEILSMGMSDSYEVAIEEGSNMVRLGKSLFEN